MNRLLVLSFLLLGCTPSTDDSRRHHVTAADASDASSATVQAACAHMASLGCGGDAGTCAAGLTNLVGIGAVVDLACITGAATKAAVQKCAGVGSGCP